MLLPEPSPPPYPVLQLSKSAAEHNLKLIREITGGRTRVMIPVKANAYGLGLAALMPFFLESDIDSLGVANPQEGAQLRKLGWQRDILNLGGFFKESLDVIVSNNITPSITDLSQVELLQAYAEGAGISIECHIKIDSGMGRLGIKPEDIRRLTALLEKAPAIKITGIFTHFANADTDDKEPTLQQLKLYNKCVDSIMRQSGLKREQVTLHAANSYGTILHRETHLDMVRPGILFYGYFNNMADRNRYGTRFNFKPLITLRATPFSLRTLLKGEKVSYGSTYTVEDEKLNVGVIPLGYADGIPRQISNRVHCENHRLIGRVTMDQIILAGVSEQKSIEIIGPSSSPVETWADLAGTISYEIITGLGNRLRRELID